MNSNELTRKVMQMVVNQIEPMVTAYMKEHPEYFHNCVRGGGMISSFDVTLSYQPDSLSDIADMNAPAMIDVRIGGLDIGNELVKYNHYAGMESRWWIKGDCHSVRTV